MEILVLGLVPLLFLLLAASMLVASQISGYFHYRRYRNREQIHGEAMGHFMGQIASAEGQLRRRSRQLEKLSHHLKLNNTELDKLNKIKSKFLSMVVHDVRSPLAAIKGFASLLRGRKTQENQQEERQHLTNILNCCGQINHLIGDLTDLAVIEAGKLRMEKMAFSLTAFVEEITPPFALLAAQKGIHFTIGDIPPGVTIIADRARFGQVLNNLLGNALKFTPPGGRIELRTRWVGETIVFSVRDTGAGIHPSEKKKIFEKFYQSRYQKDTKALSLGWGLGLMISSEIARAHGGELGVESQGLGKGSTFWVRIPLAPRVRRHMLAAAAASALTLLFLCPFSSRSQTIPLDEKAKFEDSLEKRVESVLSRVLGPNRSKVVIEATIDFTRIEKFEMKREVETAESVKKDVPYVWPADKAKAAQTEFLPHVPLPPPSPSQLLEQEKAKPQSYERQNTYPERFLQRLNVTLILDRSVGETQSKELENIVFDLLMMSRLRGDSLTIVHTSFMPIWKTILYSPDAAAMMLKYGLLSLLTLMTLIVVAVCFLKLASAMSEMAKSQSHNPPIEVRGGGTLGHDGAAELESLMEKNEEQGEIATEDDALKLEMDQDKPEVVFNVRLDQVEFLADLLQKEAPKNIAIVAAHLKDDVRQALLTRLRPTVAEEALLSLGKVRYVEAELIQELKEELERRLSGAVGGPEHLVKILAASDMMERKRLFDTLTVRDPQLAGKVRPHIFLIDDVALLDRKEWFLLFPRVTHEEWAAIASAEGQTHIAEALKNNLPPAAWTNVEQMMASKQADSMRKTAYENVAKAVAALVQSGQIVNPASRAPERLQAGVEASTQ